MPDHLAEWISNKPELIEKLKGQPLLERMLRKMSYVPEAPTTDEEEWTRIVTSLAQ